MILEYADRNHAKKEVVAAVFSTNLAMNKEAILDQTVEQLGRMNEALAALRRECFPTQPRKFAILAEGPLEEIRRLQAEIEQLAAEVATAPTPP